MSISKLMSQRILDFDTFGDIVLERDDLKVISELSATLQIISDYFKTNYGDYLFYPEFGANYDHFIGRAVTSNLVNEIVNKVTADIKKLNILPDQSFKVAGLADGNVIQVRVMILEEDDFTIYLNINTIKGISIGY